MRVVQPVDLSEAAAEELDAAHRWYELQREGLGVEFLEEFLRCVKSVAFNPRLYPIVDGEIRRAPLHRFPYGVFYRLVSDKVVIIGVFHGKRNPVHWKKRP